MKRGTVGGLPVWRAWLPWWAAAAAVLALGWLGRHIWTWPLAAACLGLGLRLWRRNRGSGTNLLGRAATFPWENVRLTPQERLRHVHCVGPSGSGKTTSVLAPLLAQDLASGAGVAVLEIKGGDLGRLVRATAARLGRPVAEWAPAGGGDVVWNPLAHPSPACAERLIFALQRVGGTSSAGAEYYQAVGAGVLRHAVGAFASAGAALDLMRLRSFLVDPRARQQVLRDVRDPLVREYFLTVFEAWRPDERLRNLQGILNHLDALLAAPEVRASLCPDGTLPTLDLDATLAEGRVLLGTLPLGSMLRLAQGLGSFLLAALQAAAYARPAPTPPCFLYLDEFQHFAGPGFADFLALCRGFGVGAVLAHQNLAQLRAAGGPALEETVLANARTSVILRCDAPDAAAFAARLPQSPGRPWSAAMLAELPFGQGVVVRRGNRSRPRARTVRLRPWMA